MRKKILCASLFGVVLFTFASSIYAQDGSVKKDKITDISDLLTDSAAGHVSAASLLGISPDSVTVVENIRGFVAAVNGLGTMGNSAGFSVAPGRTSILPMSLSTYDSGFAYRLFGNTTFSYAQGSSKIGGTDMERRAIAVEASATFYAQDDPVLVMKKKKDDGSLRCKWEPDPVPPGTEPDFSSANKKYVDCIEAEMKSISRKWNISRFSISYGTGEIRPDGGVNTRLGNTVAAGVVYGFDGIAVLKDSAAVTLTFRSTAHDPVLESLDTTSINRKSSTLGALRISGGSSIFRGLAEVSNADTRDISVSQRIFRYAAGFDYRIAAGVWVGFRIGEQRKTNGSGDEVASLLNFSFSPKGLQ